MDPVSDLRSRVGEIEGAGDVRSGVNDARRALRDSEPNEAEALAGMDAALAALDAELAWRDRAAQELAPGLQAYVDGITRSVGARALSRMPRDMALSVAACEANHHDLSLDF